MTLFSVGLLLFLMIAYALGGNFYGDLADRFPDAREPIAWMWRYALAPFWKALSLLAGGHFFVRCVRWSLNRDSTKRDVVNLDPYLQIQVEVMVRLPLNSLTGESYIGYGSERLHETWGTVSYRPPMLEDYDDIIVSAVKKALRDLHTLFCFEGRRFSNPEVVEENA